MRERVNSSMCDDHDGLVRNDAAVDSCARSGNSGVGVVYVRHGFSESFFDNFDIMKIIATVVQCIKTYQFDCVDAITHLQRKI